jgi:hypothetical protein
MKERVIYSESFYEFLSNSDSVIAHFLWKLSRKRYVSSLIHTNEINYLTFRGDGNISFLPKGKEHLQNDDGTWKRENRQDGKPAKVIRKLFSERALRLFKDADFEAFANQYKSRFNDDGYKFELLANDKIKHVYDMRCNEGDGSLNGSCMNGDTEYLDIYENCEQLRILILTNKEGRLCGRALVWQLKGDIVFMDRIYVSHDFMFDKFLDYATNQKWWRKRDFKTYANKKSFINSDGNEVYCEFRVDTDTEFDCYPYIDTFQYGGDGFLSNGDNYTYTYSNTDGGREGGEDDHEGEVYSNLEGCYIDEDDAVCITAGQSRYRDEYTYCNNAVFLDDETYHEDDENIVNVDGTWYRTDSDDLCEIDGTYYLMEDCTYCERDSCYYKSEDCVYCEPDEEDVLRDDAVEIDGNWYHVDSDLIFKHDGKYYLVDSGTEK